MRKYRKIRDCFTVPLWFGGCLLFVFGVLTYWKSLTVGGALVGALGFYLYILRW